MPRMSPDGRKLAFARAARGTADIWLLDFAALESSVGVKTVRNRSVVFGHHCWMTDHRLVYATDRGRVCSGCGWPADNCTCSTNVATARVPERIVTKLRIEKAGRGGKTVTVVYDLPRNAEFLKSLCADLKRGCGTGGTATADTVELQGDHRDRVRELLRRRGLVVEG